MARLNLHSLYKLKTEQKKIAMLTAYQYSIARILDQSDIHMILVGDSLGMTALGYTSTTPVTMQDMISATAAVSRGCEQKFLIADMPFMSYQVAVEQAVHNAGELIKAGAQAVKLEGASHLEAVTAIINAGIPVMGHLGFTPQSVNQLGGYRVQGKTEQAAAVLMEQARRLQEAGVFAIVLEMVPAEVTEKIVEALEVITIGIGAGPATDGQVLVTDDLLGMYDQLSPKFVKKYAQLSADMTRAINHFSGDVQSGVFPNASHSY